MSTEDASLAPGGEGASDDEEEEEEEEEEVSEMSFFPLFSDALPFGTFAFHEAGGARKVVTCHALESQDEEERRRLQAAEVWRGGVVAARFLGECVEAKVDAGGRGRKAYHRLLSKRTKRREACARKEDCRAWRGCWAALARRRSARRKGRAVHRLSLRGAALKHQEECVRQ